MTEYLLKRLAQIVPTLVFVSMLIFGLQQLLPGDPAKILAGEEQDPTVIAYLRDKLHLDEPLPVRYAYWVGGVLKGDLGESLRTQQPVLELMLQKLPVTMQLAAMAFAIALSIGIPAGIVSAVGRGTWWDSAANAFALWGISTPNFWLGILMILLFSVQLGWLPASGYVSPFEDLRANLAAMIMPAFVLGNAIAAVLMRHTRSAMLQVLSSDYVRTARAKGLSERAVVLKHALRNALTPVITLGALELGTLLSGAVLTEQVFTIPGFGKLIVDSVFNRDYAVVQGVVLVTATAYITLNLLADLAYFVVNPRLRGLTRATEWLQCFQHARCQPCRARRPVAPRLAAPARAGARRWSAWRSCWSSSCLAVFAPWIAPHDPIATSWGAIRKAPSAAYWFGTDEIGRDVLSRVIWGTRASLLAGVVSVSISLLLGVPIGLVGGLSRRRGRWPDLAHHRRLPGLPVPDPGDRAGRVSRPQPDQRDDRHRRLGHADLRAADARAGAQRQGRGLCRGRARGRQPAVAHRAAPCAAQRDRAADRAGDAGDRRGGDRRGQPVVPRPRPAAAGAELGQHAQHREELRRQAPWMAIWPGLAIFLLVLAFNLLGDGLRDALDPRQR